MGKHQDQDPGSGINNPDHISESLETIFWAKILKFFYADPGSGMKNSDPGWKKFGSGIRYEKFGFGIRDKHPGSATLRRASWKGGKSCKGFRRTNLGTRKI
jgi:hypothetical protein